MKPVKNRTARKVQEMLGDAFNVLEFDVPTRSAHEAAQAIGCDVSQIAKSLIFRTHADDPVLVIASGVSRVDQGKVATVLGRPISRADADFVRDKTGYSIGGVPPLGHVTPPKVLIDITLEGMSRIWAAAGTPNAVFSLRPGQLAELSGGVLLDIAE